MKPTLNDTRALVAKMHHGQVWSGHPYEYHCELVLQQLLHDFPDADEETCHLALMHDLLEDTDITTHDLIQLGYSTSLVKSLLLISRMGENAGISYLNWIRKIKNSNDIRVIRVKLSDNRVNLSNVHTLPIEKQSIANRYDRSIKILIG